MPLHSTLEVFNESISGTTVVACPVICFPLLGEADELLFHIHVGAASGGLGVSLSAVYYHSNDGQYFVQHTVLLSGETISSPPYDFMRAVAAVVADVPPLGRYGRVTLQLGGSAQNATLRVVACARSR